MSITEMQENNDYLTTQIITYLGNKRSLIGSIEQEVIAIRNKLGRDRLICADLFAGSGIVSRMLKRYSECLIVNDIENYSFVINSCYLANYSEYPSEQCSSLRSEIIASCEKEKLPGIITEHYAPKDDGHILPGERVFYTHENAVLIDTYRALIDEWVTEEGLKKVFKGFYKDKRTGIGCFGASGKNALKRILGRIELKAPVFSRFESAIELYQEDAVALSENLKRIDIAYLDPPYNQHPYGSNYFMLNLILKNKLDVAVSSVSGITQDWNRSVFNKPHSALKSMEKIVSVLDAKFVIVSYNSEGFIAFDEMVQMLKKYGKVKTVEIPYNVFRGSRNLKNRSLRVSEYLFVLEKRC